MRVHLDTDIGGDIDDVCALALLARLPDVELAGVTTVLDEGGRRAGYAQEVLRLAGVEGVPVCEGVREDHERFGGQAFGLPDGSRYWPGPVSAAPGDLGAALDLLAENVRSGALLLAIGPYSNLSLAEERHPGLLREADVVLMGGAVRPAPEGYPRLGWRDDFNVQSDVAAAVHVLSAVDPARCTLVPLEATVQTALSWRDVEAVRGAGAPDAPDALGAPDELGALGALIARQAEACAQDLGFAERFGRRHAGLPDDMVNFQHDPLAAAVAVGWPGAVVEEIPVRVALTATPERPWLRMLEDPEAPVRRVVTRVDTAAFSRFWVEGMRG